MKLTVQEYRAVENSHQGYCTHCKDLTHDCCEPDARGYECPVCEKNTVFGIQEALLMGFITIGE